MTQLSFGEMVRTLRSEKGMTQLDLARKMGVTDKAVSKWERGLSIPDVGSLPKLAEELGISVDDLLQAKNAAQEAATESGVARKKAQALIELVLKAVALAMGVGVVALTIMDAVDPRSALCLLGVGVACLALVQLMHSGDKDER
ncbi:MAG TPA: helix-turn-helix domain-containing protein [Candidatus Aphodovivens excrementavium]|nr:helix-turn-helix domain-containing protein [Candidatus Aphodovivens excrementavium]